jgi:hypothetical protein
MDLELNSEGGSGGPTSVCSDQLFDACGAEPVLDVPHGGVVGRAQPRTSSIAQLGERLRARQKVRVEVPKLTNTSGPDSVTLAAAQAARDANGRLARRRHQQQEGAPLPDQPGRVQVLPAAGGRGGGVGRGCRTGRARRRNRSSTAPGAAEPAARRSGRRPAVAPVWCAGCRPLSWVSTVRSRSEVAVAGLGK